MDLRIVPSASHDKSTSNLRNNAQSAPSAPGVPDLLRQKLTPVTQNDGASRQATSSHPLENHSLSWRGTQQNIKMEGMRRTFGISEPIRRGMELQIVRSGEWRPTALGKSAGVSSDILEGRDWECDWDDVFLGEENRTPPDFHTEVEAKLKMNW